MTKIETIDEAAQRFVQQGILCCMSHMVSTLAQGYGDDIRGDLGELCQQAGELSAPVPDYEEAARENDWEEDETGTWTHPDHDGDEYDSAEEACREHDIDASEYGREVFEHWAVDSYTADKLEAVGERVDRDFAGLNVWARTTTGQAIYIDSCIQKIAAGIVAQQKERAEKTA